jgi:hypothetical protein
MRKIFKLIMIFLMIMGIILSVLNFISVDNMASLHKSEGTVTPEGCVGAGLNC